ncbi:MAG: glutathione S-transferase N-terminal domain-containing protein [Alphaproteobacteria bacterium]
MADLCLYHGYPGVSSWSLRAWLCVRKAGLEFDRTLVDYRRPDGKAQLNALSPNGLVPLLVHRVGDRQVTVWESLAVCEYVAELAPEARLWPAGSDARALARAVSCEMHAGFAAMRACLDMDLLARREPELNDKARADIARIEAIWTQCREAYGVAQGGPWLFGHFTIADAMFAPVATRFRTYDITTGPTAAAYQAAVLADADMLAWETMAGDQPTPEREV